MENINFKFDITISKEGYDSKEKTKRNYTPSDWNVINTDLNTFSSYIKSGYTSCYIFKGNNRKKDNFVKTNIIFFDLDYMPVDFDGFISSVELKPSYAYTSYSYNEDNKIYKYRLIYLLDKEVTSIDEFNNIYYSIAKTIGISDLNAFDNRVVNQYYFGTNSSTGNFKEYISYNVYNTNEFLNCKINDLTPLLINSYSDSKHQNCSLKNINCKVIDNDVTNNKFDITEYKLSSDLIVTDSKFYFNIPDEYYEIFTIFNGYKKEKVKITNGSRTKTLYAVGQKFKHLNPDITKEELISFLNYWLKANCENETDKITFKDLTNIANSIFKTEFNAKPSKHGKFKVNMKECGDALHMEGNYNYTPLDCVHFARKKKTDNDILSNYDFTSTVSDNIENLKVLGINTTYQTIDRVMKRNGLKIKFNLKEYILEQIENNPSIKQKDIIENVKDNVSERTVINMFKKLQEENIIINKGTKKEPLWNKC